MSGARSTLPVQLVALCVLISGVYGQGQCPKPTAEQLDGNGGLISQAWADRAGGETVALPDVQLIDFNIVCLATSERAGFYRRVSLVANHTCQSLKMLPCDEGPTVSQFTFTCTADNMWDTAILGTAAFSVRPDPLATLSTSLRTDCFQCVHPDQTSRPDVDQITHCIPCDAACQSSGSGQCVLDGCCPFFESDGEGCVDACGPNQQPDQDFICQNLEPIEIGFELATHTFTESVGVATVSLSASASINFTFSIQISGGPGDQPEDIVVSGRDVSETIDQLPATISFTITNDDVALEGEEIYSLTISVISSDGPLTVGGANLYNSTQITIIDDDVIVIGILPPGIPGSPVEYIYSEDDSSAFIIVGGSSAIATALNFSILAMQSGANEFISASLSFPFIIEVQFAPGGIPLINIPLPFMDDEIALENDEVISFTVVPPGIPGVVVGGTVLTPEGSILGVFQDSVNMTVLDNDVPIVGFQQERYVFVEGAGSQVTVSVTRILSVSRPFTVRITGGPMPEDGLVISGPSIDDVITFAGGSVTPLIDIPFPIQDDSVPNEPLEVFNLTLSEPSDSRVLIGGSVDSIITVFAQTEINIADDDVETTTETPTQPTTQPTTAAPTQPTTQPIITTAAPTTQVELTTTQPPPTTTAPEPITSAPPLLRNHTVIGDPLFTVPILVNGKQDTLCYEIHGRASRFFNLISDACVSVSAAYVEVHANSTNEPLNVIGEVGVLAIDNAGECVRISIEAESCKAAVNSVPVDDVMYSSQGVRVRQGRNYVRVSAPNCADSTLTMWTLCRSLEGNAMIKFVVTRGLNLRETAHGLIGQFWNVPYSISDFEGRLRDSEESTDRVFMVTVRNPSGDELRTFPAWREDLIWEGLSDPCLYAGNRQGGQIYEVLGEQDSVIEGNYAEYQVQGLYGTRFKYSHFNNTVCT